MGYDFLGMALIMIEKKKIKVLFYLFFKNQNQCILPFKRKSIFSICWYNQTLYSWTCFIDAIVE